MNTLTRDGRALRYLDEGRGPALVLVHGWCSNHRAFDKQVAHFAATHRVVVPDLRGHGESDPADAYTIEAFADDVAWLSRELGLQRPVVVGHSMGALIAVEAAAAYPDVFRAAVSLDGPLMVIEALREGMRAQIDLWAGPDRESQGPGWLRAGLFGPYDDAAWADAHVAEMMRTPVQVAVPALESTRIWPERRRLLDCVQPVLCVHLAGGGMTDPTAFAAGRPNVFVAQTVGSGHFIQVEVPDQVHAMMERFLRILDRPV
jgi:pimeloyl-ACP methyl ester carboxylesterase